MSNSDTPRGLSTFEKSLGDPKFPAQAEMSIDDLIDRLEADHRRLGDSIARLKAGLTQQVQTMNEASEVILRLIRMTSK